MRYSLICFCLLVLLASPLSAHDDQAGRFPGAYQEVPGWKEAVEELDQRLKKLEARPDLSAEIKRLDEKIEYSQLYIDREVVWIHWAIGTALTLISIGIALLSFLGVRSYRELKEETRETSERVATSKLGEFWHSEGKAYLEMMVQDSVASGEIEYGGENREKTKVLSEQIVDFKAPHTYSSKDWFVLGVNALFEDDWSLAIKRFTRAIDLDEKFYRAYCNRGFAYSKVGDSSSALADFDTAISISEHSPKAYNNRGLHFCEEGDYERAIEDYQRAVDLDKDYTTGYLNIAELQLLTGKLEACLNTLLDASSLITEAEDKAISAYLRCILAKLFSVDTSEVDAEFENAISYDFDLIWSTTAVENWLETAEFDDETKAYIREKTEQFKRK